MDERPWDRDEFLARLRDVGRRAYHDKHPFHVAMNAGGLTPAQVRGWVANRFHYQRNIPVKDAAILANCPLWEVRRGWVRRILVHDGTRDGEGGIEAWLRLGEAAGLDREALLDGRHVVPGVEMAVSEYVRLAREEPWPVAVASSLTELFAPDLMAERLRGFERHYPWVPSWGLDYFRTRLTQARVDSDEGLDLTLAHCTTRVLQRRAVGALEEKCRILWAMLDAVAAAYGIGPADGPPSLAPGVRLRDDPHGGGVVLLYPEGVLRLDGTGAAILALCDGRRGLDAIAAELAAASGAAIEVVARDVGEFLDELAARMLVLLPSAEAR